MRQGKTSPSDIFFSNETLELYLPKALYDYEADLVEQSHFVALVLI